MKKIEKLKKYTELLNIVPEISENKLEQIRQEVMQEYNNSLSTMSNYIDEWKKYIKLVYMLSERDKPFEGASDMVFPLCSNAVINLAAKAFNAFFPDQDIYKAKIIGEDNGEPETINGEPVINPQTNQPEMINVGEKSKIANRLALIMNYQVNNLIHSYKKDTIQLLYGVFILGTMYRKEGFDYIRNKSYSKIIFPDKIIVNKEISSIEDSPYTEEFYFYENEIRANINRGLFIDYDYNANQQSYSSENSIRIDNSQNTEKGKIKFIEQHTFLDLDEDGYKEPYCVIIDTQNQKIVRISADYNSEGIQEKDNLIYHIERIINLISYHCILSFDGSFFSLGLPFFLKNINSSINTSINQMIDASHLSLKRGGFVANDLNVRGGALTLKMAEFKKVISIGGGNIAEKFYTPPSPEPSPVMMGLLGTMIEAGKDIGLLRDVLTGNVQANMAPTTFLGLTENAVSIENSIFKLLNESFIKEIKVRRKLNSSFFDRDLYHRITKTNSKEVYPPNDFDYDEVDIVLLTDISSITKSQKMAKAQIYESLLQDPYYNGLELRKKRNEVIGMPELNNILSIPEPSPQADIIFAQAESQKAQAKFIDSQSQAIKVAAEIEEKADKLGLMLAEIEVKKSQAIKNISDVIAQQEKISIEKIKNELEKLYTQPKLINENVTDERTSNNTEMVEQSDNETLS